MLAAPRKTLKAEHGDVAALRIAFVEKGPEVDALFVLPDVVGPNAELTEDALETAAGGITGGCTEPFGEGEGEAGPNLTRSPVNLPIERVTWMLRPRNLLILKDRGFETSNVVP